jgi:ribosomal protein L11 methyltransferase
MDNDSDAVEAARENLALNQCPGISLSSQTLDKHVGEFDIILSNIMLSTHQSLFGEYLRLLASGGQLVLSGLLSEQKEEAFKLVQSHGFEVDNVQTQKEWIALLTRRASPSSSSAT